MQLVKEGLHGPFATDRIAKEEYQKVKCLVPTKAPARSAHLGAERIEESMTAQLASNKDDLGKPRRHRRLGSRSGVDVHTRMCYGAHDDLLEGNADLRVLTLEVDFLAALQGFFSYLFLPRTLVAHLLRK
jgi:hypothetical protein